MQGPPISLAAHCSFVAWFAKTGFVMTSRGSQRNGLVSAARRARTAADCDREEISAANPSARAHRSVIGSEPHVGPASIRVRGSPSVSLPASSQSLAFEAKAL